jgi:hypothetical protein
MSYSAPMILIWPCASIPFRIGLRSPARLVVELYGLYQMGDV